VAQVVPAQYRGGNNSSKRLRVASRVGVAHHCATPPCRVGRVPRGTLPPSEPCLHLSAYTAQASHHPYGWSTIIPPSQVLIPFTTVPSLRCPGGLYLSRRFSSLTLVDRWRPAGSRPPFSVRPSGHLYPSHYKRAFASSSIPYPLDDSAFLAVGLLPSNREGRVHRAYRVSRG